MAAPLSLDSPRWAELDDAYGAASGVPQMLRDAASGDDIPWNALWGALCHQGSVYGASFVAVPHLVELARRSADPELRARCLTLAAHIRGSTDDRSRVSLTAEEHDAYDHALREARPMFLAVLRGASQDEAPYLLAAACLLQGFVDLGRAIEGIAGGEIFVERGSCDHPVVVAPCEGPWRAFTGFTPAASSEMTPRSRGSEPLEAQRRWLLELTEAAGLGWAADAIPWLFAEGRCPACCAPFALVGDG